MIKGNGTGQFKSTFERFVQAPDKYRIESILDWKGRRVTRIFVQNGEERWEKVGDRIREISKESVSWGPPQGPCAVLELRNPMNRLMLLGETKVGDHTAVAIKVMPKDGPDWSWFFDQESGMLLSDEYRLKNRHDKESFYQTRYGDYQEMHGYPITRTTTLSIDGI